jgi:hypothetical protein
MTTPHHPSLFALLIVVLLAGHVSAQTPAPAGAVATPRMVSAVKLPPIWEQAGPRERLKAVRAAEIDGNRLLLERIFGLQIDSDTTVGDLAMADDEINGFVQRSIKGAVTEGDPVFHDDGRVELTRTVKIREIIEKVKSRSSTQQNADGSERTTSSSKVERGPQDRLVSVMGNAALPKSRGQDRLMAKRAAEMDAYRKLAERMMGVQVTSDSTVRDMCVESDEVTANVAQALVAGAKPTDIKYVDDGTCEVTMQVEVETVLRTIKQRSGSAGSSTKIKDTVDTTSFTETGFGTVAAGEAAPGMVGMEVSTNSDPFYGVESVKSVVTQVVSAKPVVQ